MTDYYVDTAVGNDSNAGTSEGSGNAWATIQKAENTVVAGDKVWVKASGNYNEQVTLSLSFLTTNVSVVFEGYTTTTGDGGVATIDGQSTRASCVTSGGVTKNFRVWKNFRFTGATNHGYHDDAGDFGLFINCEFDNNTNDGILTDNDDTFINCSAHDNGRFGFNTGVGSAFVNCVAYNNTSSGISGAPGYFIHCLTYENGVGANTIQASQRGDKLIMANCTLDQGSTSGAGDCVSFFKSYPTVFINNIFYQGSYGISPDNGTQGGVFYADNNLFYDYSVADINGTDVDEGANNIDAQNPLFTAPDTTPPDYSISATSPAKDTGQSTRVT